MSQSTSMGDYCGRIWKYRYFWMSLVKLDLQARYRRSMLGIGWSLLHPIAMTTVLCVVFHQMFKLDLRQYAPFVLSGIATWNYLTAVTLEGCHSLLTGEKFIRSHPLPMAIYPLRTVLSVGFHFVIILALTILLAWAAHPLSNPLALLTLVPTLVLLFLFGWSMAVLFGFANIYFPDTHHLTQIAFQVLYYLTPVFYPADLMKIKLLHAIVAYNPLGNFVMLIRDPLLNARSPSMATFGLAGLTVFLTCCAAIYTLKRQERKVIFYM